jgi:hypothetical protein
VALRTVVSWTQASHISRITSAAIDEDDRCEKGKDNQETEEKEPPRLDVRESESPKRPQERDIKEDTVTSCYGRKPGVSKLIFKEIRNFFFGDQAFV